MNLRKIISLPKANQGKSQTMEIVGSLLLEEWYLDQYPEVASSGLSPVEHYVSVGEQAGYWPNPFFDPTYYLSVAPGAKKSDGLALVHYASKGWRRGRNPSRGFSQKLYFQEHPEVKTLDVDPLSYHLKKGRYAGHLALPVTLEYKRNARYVAQMKLIHASGLFDANWYRSYYSDLKHAGMDPLFHYVKFGWKEKRRPNIFFEPKWYNDNYAESVGDMNPLVHYITVGADNGFNPSQAFCTKTYRQQNRERLTPGENPLAHYMREGMRLGLTKPIPSPTRSTDSTRLPVPQFLRDVTRFKKQKIAPSRPDFNPKQMVIHWVVPAFAPGGGGHMTIFRMLHFLELAGHQQTLWIHNPGKDETVESVYHMLENHFQHFTGDIRFVDETLQAAEGDAIIATDCWTVYPVLACAKFHRRFYFVQDFEPSFHPMGSNYLLADQTYREDLDCLCASPWLSKLMSEDYGRWARHFWLAADRRIYQPPAKKHLNSKPRIAVYARHFTARRAVELAFLALEELAQSGSEFAVDFFGAPLDFNSAGFEFVDHGVASQEELARIFQRADIGLVFSATNYSLVPQEMMACGLPIVELDGDSTRAIFPADTVTLAEPHPTAIAGAVQSLIDDERARETQAKAALEWVSQFSWAASADLVEQAIRDRLAEVATPEETAHPAAAALPGTPKASVVIPTLNAGEVFEAVLEAVVSQRTPWPFEILVVDSGSTDGTLETVAKYENVKLHEIDKSAFNHGATRNLGAELTSGEFIAFLTHDAMPVNERWLYNMVTSIERYPAAAGAFGKHFAWPEASAFTKRDLNSHFEGFAQLPIAVSQKTDEKRWKKQDTGWLQKLHFYSDNNSCFRRNVWEKIPYRTVAFGEDQLWAWDVINAGYEKVYAPQAAVYHSHDYGEEETFERSRIESAFFKRFFNYELIKDEQDLADTIELLNSSDALWGENRDVGKEEIETRLQLNKARLRGYLAGVINAEEEIF